MIPEDVKKLARETLQLVYAESARAGSSIHEMHEAKVGHIARAILTDREARSVIPAGYKLVPVEPTVEMIEAGREEIGQVGASMLDAGDDWIGTPQAVYSAMLAASPSPSREETEGEKEELPDEKPNEPIESRPEWIWYCESTSGVPVVTFGRWPKHPQQARYKLADVQPTEHDHPRVDPSALLLEAEKALEPFAKAFERARETYSKRYSDNALGAANFDKMPDSWAMDNLTFSMGNFRAARSTLSKIRGGA